MRNSIACVLAVAALAGCSSSEKSPPTPVSSTAPVDAASVCGVNPADIASVTEYAPDKWSDNLRVTEGAGTGRCVASSEEAEGEILVVTLRLLDDPEVDAIREQLAGERGRPPGYRYDPSVLEGGAWGTDNTLNDRRNASATSHAFWGRTVISVYVSPLGARRHGADDLLNLTYQVIESYDLERDEP